VVALVRLGRLARLQVLAQLLPPTLTITGAPRS